ncbi:hypothetical protein [Flavobacterium sp. 25HG05S-40]|uniref:hypothetical protein n=1 Tax=Flavobacterium sp. 25HG05S-40 TaxID=3458682 RepID=UPI004044A7FF
MNWQIIWNPFIKFSEKQLLLIGLASMLIGSYLATIFGVTYDGVIDVHLNQEMSFIHSMKENIIIVLLITFLLFGLGKIINPKTRFIDIVNASLIYRIPFYVSAVLVSIPAVKKIEEAMLKESGNFAKIKFETLDLALLLVMSLLLIILLIYALALLYHGFKTASNAKQLKHIVFFCITILIAEILSKILIPTL